MSRPNSKTKEPKAAKAPKEKPVKAKKEKAPKVAKTPKQPKQPKHRVAKVAYKSDLYTLLLLFSFLALVVTCIFLYVNNAYDAQFM